MFVGPCIIVITEE